MTHPDRIKDVFYAVLQQFAGKEEGISAAELTKHFVTRHYKSPSTILTWLKEANGQIQRKGGRVFVVQDADFSSTGKVYERPQKSRRDGDGFRGKESHSGQKPKHPPAQ